MKIKWATISWATIRYLCYLPALSLLMGVPLHAAAQSIGFSVGATFAHINKSNFNQGANLDDFEVRTLSAPNIMNKISLALNFEYPLTDKLRLRTEASYFASGYEVRLPIGNLAHSTGFGFMNLQGALLADYTVLRLNHRSYLAVHGGMSISYVASNLTVRGKHARMGSLNASALTSIENTAPLLPNSSVNIGLITGASFNRVSHVGKFSIGFNYNRALQSSPQTQLSMLRYGTQLYDEMLSPHLHLLNVYVGYSWFLNKREKKKE